MCIGSPSRNTGERMNQREIINPYRSEYRTFIVAAFLLNGIALFGFGTGNQDAFWIGVLQFSLFGLGVLLLIAGRMQAHRLGVLQNNNGLLAHWEYSRETAKQWSRDRYARNKNITSAATIVMLLAGPLIAAGTPEMTSESGFILGTILGGIAFLTGRMYSYDSLLKNTSLPNDLLVAGDRMYIFNHFCRWNILGKKIETVVIASSGNFSNAMVITFVSPLTFFLKQRIVIPIPEGKKGEAEKLSALLFPKA
jgi:hypothetical protein